MPLVEIENLTFCYPGSNQPSLVDINITIEKGDFAILTGPSGCGKTTLCRCLNGLIPHFYSGKIEGKVFVCNLPVMDTSTSDLAQYVGFVFQNPENQLFALSVEKDIAFGLENLAVPREEIRKRIEWAMSVTNITDLREKAPHELSGGQQQRVAIASVLSMRPELIVLDEPTSFLDPMASRELFELIYKLNKEQKMTIVLVEHRLELLSTYAKRVIVMDEGRIKADGTPLEVLSSQQIIPLGIGVPKVMRLYQKLKENGLDLGTPTLSVEELAIYIRKLLKND